ncbi:MAG: phage portal protein, SPP1 [uncultured Thermomicrobiales bacterium]|uniref:Phage portal protein, SPP1 n=1 Tax=uncultured Thermomicrobiales bacterium TaxID=1645740 RepID=A0A6J4V3Y4_9BACT|nr:MAG: phage portal protein, SPP1 [uncultured Thermomicrobiales bacterium]
MHPRIIPLPTIDDPDSARFARYRDALAFYEGDQWAERSRRGETRLTVNYARTLVRKVASYLFPAPVGFSVPPMVAGDAAAEAAAHRAERLLADLAARLGLGQLDLDLAIEAAVLGDAVMKVTWDAGADGGAGAPVVAAVDPAALLAWWAPDNPRRLLRVTHGYGLTGAVIGALFPPGAPPGDAPPTDTPTGPTAVTGTTGPGRRGWPFGLDPEETYQVTEEWTDAHWRVTVQGYAVRDEPNPYGWIPYVIVANNPRPHHPWGTSDLVDLVDVCRELNRRLSVLGRILDLSGAPIAVLENVEGSEGISVGPGAKWELPEGARAYLLDLLGGGGVGLHVEYINLLYRSLHDLSETPRTAFGDSGRDLSGVALEVEIQPLIQQVNRKRRAWETAFQARNRRLLDLCERFGGADIAGHRRTETIWPDVLPSDTAASIANQVRLVSAGIRSRRSAIGDLGGSDPDGELDRIADESARFGGLSGEFVGRLP